MGLLGFSRNFWVLLLSWVSFRFANGISMTFYPNYVVALGGSEALVGVLFAISNIAFALFQVPGGYLADRVGRKRLVVAMTWLIAVVELGVALAPSWWFLAVLAFVDGASRMYVAALRALLYDSLAPESRARGVMLSEVVPSLVAIPAPWIGGVIASSFGDPVSGYRALYLIAFALALVAAGLRTALVETIEPREELSLATIARAIARSYRGLPRTLASVPRGAKVAVFAVAPWFSVSMGMYMPYLVRVARLRGGVSDAVWGAMVSLSMLATAVLSTASMPMVDRVPRRVLASLGVGATVLGLVAFAAHDQALMTAGLVLVFLGRTLFTSGYASFIADVTPQGIRGSVASLDNIASIGFSTVGNLAAAALFPTLYEGLLYVASALAALTLGPLALLRRGRTPSK